MKSKFKNVCICASSILIFSGLFSLSSCTKGGFIEDSNTISIDRNENFEIEIKKLNFALNQDVDTVDVLVKSKCYFDENGNKTYLTADDLQSSKFTYNTIDTSKTGSYTLTLNYNDKSYDIAYDVDKYTVNFYEEKSQLYKTITPTISLNDDLSLSCSVNLTDRANNYAVDSYVIANKPDQGLKFSGWKDADGNLLTGNYVIQQPQEGYEQIVNLYADYLTDEEFASYNLSYSGATDKVFSGYVGETAIKTLMIPESVTNLNLKNIFESGINYTELSIPSTATVSSIQDYLDSTGLQKILVNENNLHYFSYDGILYEKISNRLIYAPNDVAEDFEFCNNLTIIGSFSFSYSNLTSITLPETTSVLGDYCFAYSSLLNINNLNSKINVGRDIFYKSFYTEPSFTDEFGGTYSKFGDDNELVLTKFENIKNVTSYKLNENTKTISSNAFLGSTLSEIILNDGLELISNNAFDNCGNLKSIVIPDSVKKMGNRVFANCASLETATIPLLTYMEDGNQEYEKTLPEGTFYNCTALKTVYISDEFEYLAHAAFNNCAALEEFTLPTNLLYVGDHAFSLCENLKTIVFNDALETIDIYAFMSSGLTTVDLSNTKLDKISAYSFSACMNLTSAILPETVKSIEMQGFYNCSKLKNLELQEGIESLKTYALSRTGIQTIILPNSLKTIDVRAFSYSALTSIVIPDNVTSIGGYAFHSCTSLSKVTLGKSVEKFGEYPYLDDGVTFGSVQPALYGTKALEVIQVDEENPYFMSKDNILYSKDKSVLYFCGPKNPIPAIVTDSATKTICPYAFNALSTVTSITLNEGLENLGKGSFYGTTTIISINIPSTVTTLGAGIVTGCSKLISFTISEGCIYSAVDNLIYENDGKDLILCPLSLNGEISIKEGTETIKMGVFLNSKTITGLVLPDSLKIVSEKVFAGCEALEKIHIGASTTTIDTSNFNNLPALKTITLSSENKSYKLDDGVLYSFDGKTLVLCPAQKNYIDLTFLLPTVEQIGDYACCYNNYLKQLILPNNVNRIGNYSFYECDNVTYFDSGDTVNYIGIYALGFYGTETGAINNALKIVVFGKNITEIDDNAFYGHYGITNTYFRCDYDRALSIADIQQNTHKNSGFYLNGVHDSDGNYINHILLAVYSEDKPVIYSNTFEFWHYDEEGQMILWPRVEAEENK